MLGVAMASASSAVFYLRLYQLRNQIRQQHPSFWDSEKLEKNSKNPVLLYSRLKEISMKPGLGDASLEEKLTSLNWLYLSTAAGLVVVLSGVVISLLLS